MSQNTAIQWAHHTVNWWWGCTKVSEACADCYADVFSSRVSQTHFGRKVEWGPGKPRAERLAKAREELLAIDRRCAKKGIRERVFHNSMSDWLDKEVPGDWLPVMIQTIFETPHVDHLLLTKRPQNFPVLTLAAGLHLMGYRDGQPGNKPTAEPMLSRDLLEAMLGWSKGELAPHNVWVGTTVENQQRADERIPELLKIPAKVRFLSCEPLLGPVNLCFTGGSQSATPYYLRGNFWEIACENHCSFAGREDDLIPDPEQTDVDAAASGTRYVCPKCLSDSALIYRDESYPELHWVIAGGKSGGRTEPTHLHWFRSLRDQCATAGVPFFFKQWGDYIPAGSHAQAVLPVTGRYRHHKMDEGDPQDGAIMLRGGTHLTGNLLDGRQHLEFPQ